MALILDGTAGITTPALSDSGNLTFTGTGNRIIGDMSNGTLTNRVAFQTSTTNAGTVLTVIPNGTGSAAQLNLESDVNQANGVSFQILANTGGTECRLQSGIRGTGTYLPMTFYTGGSERMRIDTSGNVLFNTSTARTLFFNGSNTPLVQIEGTTFNTASMSIVRNANDTTQPFLVLGKTRGTTVGGTAAVQQADTLGAISFQGSDGTELVEGARIYAYIDQTPGANDMPTSLIFSTTADGAATSSTRMVIDSTGNLLVGTTSAATPSTTGFISTANTFGFKNRLINGAMMIDQRNAGAAVTWNAGNLFGVDRFRSATAGQTWGTGVITAQQSTTAPAGFYNSQKLTVATADSSIAATDAYIMIQPIEANNVADFNWGSANASACTLSFWVRSSVTGTYGGSVIAGGSTGYSYVFTYTVSVADTWTFVSINVPAQTTNNTPTTGTGVGIFVEFDLGSGSNLNGTANTWQSGTYTKTSGCVNWISNAAATFYITGVQLEKGTAATSFDYRPYGTELALCQRYYQTAGSSAICYDSAGLNWQFCLHQTMRASPTVTFSYGGVANRLRKTTDGTTTTSNGAITYSISADSAQYFYSPSGWGTALVVGQSYDFSNTFSAEL